VWSTLNPSNLWSSFGSLFVSDSQDSLGFELKSEKLQLVIRIFPSGLGSEAEDSVGQMASKDSTVPHESPHLQQINDYQVIGAALVDGLLFLKRPREFERIIVQRDPLYTAFLSLRHLQALPDVIGLILSTWLEFHRCISMQSTTDENFLVATPFRVIKYYDRYGCVHSELPIPFDGRTFSLNFAFSEVPTNNKVNVMVGVTNMDPRDKCWNCLWDTLNPKFTIDSAIKGDQFTFELNTRQRLMVLKKNGSNFLLQLQTCPDTSKLWVCLDLPYQIFQEINLTYF